MTNKRKSNSYSGGDGGDVKINDGTPGTPKPTPK